jgi:hypothetical protein
MALPNGAGGYQLGDGNLNEVVLSVSTVLAKTAAATLTAAELVNDVITYNGATANLTLPLATDVDTFVSSAKVNSSFQFAIVNTGSNTATVVTNTGWTLVGSMAVATAVSGQFLAIKTGTGTWSLYRIA